MQLLSHLLTKGTNMLMKSNRSLALFAFLQLGLLCGCGGKNLGYVSGKVTMDGKPLPNAMVTFTPVEGGRPAAARTNESGQYELIYDRDSGGALIGEHVVRITTYSEVVKDDGDSVDIHPETVPERYNVNSELKATVESGSNEYNFDLTSGGEVFQPSEIPEDDA